MGIIYSHIYIMGIVVYLVYHKDEKRKLIN